LYYNDNNISNNYFLTLRPGYCTYYTAYNTKVYNK